MLCVPCTHTHRVGRILIILAFAVMVTALPQTGFAQTATDPLTIFNNYFVTGDYVVSGWIETSSDGTYATGTITFPDPKNPAQSGVITSLPKGADIIAAYLYWGTVESGQSAFRGEQAFFNGYSITGTVLPSASGTISWSSGGCSGGSSGTKTVRMYRADVRPYLPLDLNLSSTTVGALLANGTFQARFADTGSTGNGAPNALGASLVVIYRVLSPTVPLTAISIYDGAYAPSTQVPNVFQTMRGFYEPATSPAAKLTHIVANGQTNKGETVYFGSNQLPSLYTSIYGPNAPPFPGLYGMWDNPTWIVSGFVNGMVPGFDTWETTSVNPTSTQSGCVTWGAMIFSTTVQDSDGDGLLDTWELSHGYTDVVSGNQVALPGADPAVKDLFVEIDYLSNMDGSAGTYLHSHLPKQAALDMVGDAFKNAPVDWDNTMNKYKGVKVHFDVGGVYQGDPYVVPNGAGGNAISEGALVCTDGTTLCPFPGQPVTAWKGGFLFVKDNPTVPNSNPPVPLGNFQAGRGDSYHYVLFGHALGDPRSYWTTAANALSIASVPQLVSIVNNGVSTTVTLQSPAAVLKPGDPVVQGDPAFGDANLDRVTIIGALGQPALNGVYQFSGVTNNAGNNGTTLTTFTIMASNLPVGTYNYSNEPQLAVAYAGATSTSGHSDFGGGGDSAITFGLWGFDDPIGCQGDPSQSLQSGQVYCNNKLGTVLQQAGTLMHEIGHNLTLTHGGTYYTDLQNPFVPSYGLNCKPNFLSIMSYLFQARGFTDGKIDYSGQIFSPLSEGSLNEVTGIGLDSQGNLAAHPTRWYAQPNSLNTQLSQFALRHCDGTPKGQNETAVRVDGSTFSGNLDWNNNLIIDQPGPVAWQDVNFNGSTAASPDAPFPAFNDWQSFDLRQVNTRTSAFGLSGGGGLLTGGGGLLTGGGGLLTGGGGLLTGGGGIDNNGAGLLTGGGGLLTGGGGLLTGGGGLLTGGGGLLTGGGGEQNEETANATADPPTGLTCSVARNNVPGCVSSSGSFVENAKSVPLSWTPPGSGQIRKYFVWRALGSFSTLQQVQQNIALFTNIKTLTGTPPATFYIDSNVKNNTTYTYFVTDANKQGAQSGPSNPLVVFVKF